MTTTAKPPANFTEVTDKRGRVYRVGETDRDILGHSRALMVVLPWVAMMAISVFEYALRRPPRTRFPTAHGWTSSNTFWMLAVWVFFQAGVAFPAGRLREKGILSARAAMMVGAVGSRWSASSAIAHVHSVVLRLSRLRRVRRDRRRPGLRDLHQHGRQVVSRSGAAARRDSSTADSPTARAVHLHLQLRPRHPATTYVGSSTWSASSCWCVVARLRLLLQGPAEELVARRRRPAQVGEQQRIRRGEPGEEPARRAAVHARWRRSRPACCR